MRRPHAVLTFALLLACTPALGAAKKPKKVGGRKKGVRKAAAPHCK